MRISWERKPSLAGIIQRHVKGLVNTSKTKEPHWNQCFNGPSQNCDKEGFNVRVSRRAQHEVRIARHCQGFSLVYKLALFARSFYFPRVSMRDGSPAASGLVRILRTGKQALSFGQERMRNRS